MHIPPSNITYVACKVVAMFNWGCGRCDSCCLLPLPLSLRVSAGSKAAFNDVGSGGLVSTNAFIGDAPSNRNTQSSICAKKKEKF